MLNSKTVFVFGAGASKEVNLPVGSNLRRIIYDKLDFRVSSSGNRNPNYGDETLLIITFRRANAFAMEFFFLRQ
jgi:hypothetical protein